MVVAWRAMTAAATTESQKNSLRIQLEQQGEELDVFLDRLSNAAQGTLSQADLIKNASRAMLLGIPADEMIELMEIAAASATAMGISTTVAFDKITLGVGKQSKLVLDEVGIVLSLTEVYKEYAAELGKSTDLLTAAEKQTALLNAVQEQGAGRVEAFRDAMDKANLTQQRFTAEWANFTNFAGKVLNKALAGIASLLAVSVHRIISFTEGLAKTGVVLLEIINIMGFGMPKAFLKFQVGIDKLKAFDDAADKAQERVLSFQEAASEFAGTWDDAGESGATMGEKLSIVSDNLDTVEDQADDTSESIEDLDEAQKDAADSAEKLGKQERDNVAPALDQVAQKARITARAFDELAASQGRAAAIAAALEGGGRLVNAGSGGGSASGRVRLPGGGSRLIRPKTGQTLFSFSGGSYTFVNGRRARVMPDGRVVYD
jgi:hypothetical protein